MPQLTGSHSAREQCGPIAQSNSQPACIERLEMTHEIQIDDMRAMNPQELRWIETSLEFGKRQIDEMSSSTRMNCHTVVFRLEPLDILDEYRRDLDLASPNRAMIRFFSRRTAIWSG